VYRRVLEAMPEFVDEVIVVDNNSTDRTHDVATSLGAKGDSRGISEATAAVTSAGSPSATGDIIVTRATATIAIPSTRSPIYSKPSCISGVDFLNASRFPVRDPETP